MISQVPTSSFRRPICMYVRRGVYAERRRGSRFHFRQGDRVGYVWDMCVVAAVVVLDGGWESIYPLFLGRTSIVYRRIHHTIGRCRVIGHGPTIITSSTTWPTGSSTLRLGSRRCRSVQGSTTSGTIGRTERHPTFRNCYGPKIVNSIYDTAARDP
ncbi:hypothetical protein K504DRAFT_31948 [Pleomassaria siparia CBS 279.74]|uniref:Uncharacterized protein n=1 Tax=Pleomassaria siparia CBS 279.74 TaxID=1314801 RepID=A0A6G1KS17_9PLEO|nr:hypothetical protein K504DRAFT_31948 [Pleomassaria siparia CBS 279.74]